MDPLANRHLKFFSIAVMLGPAITITVLIGPVFGGLIGTLLPAFGYFPPLGFTQVSVDAFKALFNQPGFITSTRHSYAVGLLAPGFSFVIVMAVLAAWGESRAFKGLKMVLSPLMSVPHAAAAFGLAFLIAPSGWVMRLASPHITGFERPPDWVVINDPYGIALIVGLAAKEIPFLLLISLAALGQLDTRRRLTIAQSMGYGRMAGWLKAIFSALYGRIRLPLFAVIAFSASAVETALILGPSRPPVLAVRVLEWRMDPDLERYLLAAAGAVWQAIIVLLALASWVLLEKIVGACCRGALSDGRRFRDDRFWRIWAAFSATLMALSILIGLLCLALWSFTQRWRFPDPLPQHFTLDIWGAALPALATPLLNTLVIGGVATGLSILLVLLCLEKERQQRVQLPRWTFWILFCPLIIPQVSFLFGTAAVFSHMGLSGGLLGTVIAHMVFVLPYVFLTLAGPWRRQDPRYELVAASLGASALKQFWQVRLPLLLPAALVAAAIGFAVSVSLYLPTLFIGAGRLETLTTEAVTLASGGNRRLIGAYSILQTLVAFAGFWLASSATWALYRNRRGMRGGSR